MKRVFHEIDQSTDDWLQLRMGFITSSNFAKIMANYPGGFGNPALEYAMRIAIEGQTKSSVETFKSEWMERGIELEQDAREQYQIETFSEVAPGGFMEMGRIGSSSDGLTGKGMIEIKSPKYTTHFERLIKGGMDLKYKWQVHGQMWIYDRPWVDFVSYCPDFPQRKQLYVFRVERDAETEKKLITRLNQFVQQVDLYINILDK